MAAEAHTARTVLQGRMPYNNQGKAKVVQALKDVQDDSPEVADTLDALKGLRRRKKVTDRSASSRRPPRSAPSRAGSQSARWSAPAGQ